MKKGTLFFISILKAQQSFAGVNFYNCDSSDTLKILKAGNSASLFVRIEDQRILFTNRNKIWNYLSINEKNDVEVIFKSDEPQNLLQSNDLVAHVPHKLLDGDEHGQISILNTTNNNQQTYDCSLEKLSL